MNVQLQKTKQQKPINIKKKKVNQASLVTYNTLNLQSSALQKLKSLVTLKDDEKVGKIVLIYDYWR